MTFIRQQAKRKNIQLIEKIPFNLPTMMLDERRMRQVLINLLNNAVKFTPENKSITLEVALRDNYLRIAVIDTGIGIASENIPKLFQPFIQIDSALNRQYVGTGLGLVLVKRIVELHNGQVELTSEIGVGSSFVLNIPYNPASSPPSSSPTPSSCPPAFLVTSKPRGIALSWQKMALRRSPLPKIIILT